MTWISSTSREDQHGTRYIKSEVDDDIFYSINGDTEEYGEFGMRYIIKIIVQLMSLQLQSPLIDKIKKAQWVFQGYRSSEKY